MLHPYALISFKISKGIWAIQKRKKRGKIYNVHAKGHERKRGTKMPAKKKKKKKA
jgi:hypothetical protein